MTSHFTTVKRDMEEYIKGTCQYMCPSSELKFREKQGIVHKFEILPGTEKHKYPKADPKKTVKCFVRCAASQKVPNPSSLRTLPALQRTVDYLLTEIVSIDTCDWIVVYDFIFDRLWSVRQDMIIQNLPSIEVFPSIHLLEPVVRFLAYAGYRLCEEPIQKFDYAINYQHLTECLRKLLNLYDEWSIRNAYQHDYQKLNIDKRLEMEAMYQLLFLGCAESITRGLQLEKSLRSSTFNTTLQMSLAYFSGNYVRVCKMMKTLPPLLACVASYQLPSIRRKALVTMNVAFSSRNLTYPASALQDLLLFKNLDRVVEECQHFGIQVSGENISFQKGIFDIYAATGHHHKVAWIDEMLCTICLPDLLLKCLKNGSF